MRIAIISFYHSESSLCLAKYLAKQNCVVDYYYIVNYVHDMRGSSGFEYPKARRLIGNHKLSYNENPEIYNYFGENKVNLFLTRILHYSRYPYIDKYLMRMFMTQIRLKKYDAINIVGQYSYIEVAHEVFKNENVIHTFHELGNHDGELELLPVVEKAVLDRSKIILHSNALYERLCTYEKVDNKKLSVIPFGKFETYLAYDKGKKFPIPFKDNKPIFLFYGFLQPYKGLDVLKESLELLGNYNRKFNLIIAGNGEDSNLEYYKKLSNCLVVNKFLPNDEMLFYIKSASLILLPYKSASQTGIIPTCAVYGKPCIATKVGAFPEMIKDGINGLLVESNSPLEFAKAIKRIFDEDGLLEKMSKKINAFGEGDYYDWDSIAIKTLRFFESQQEQI